MQKESEYQKEKDEILIEQLRSGQEEITDYIMDKYKNLVRKRANTMFLIGGDTDDLIQEGMIGLCRSLHYQTDLSCSGSVSAQKTPAVEYVRLFKCTDGTGRRRHAVGFAGISGEHESRTASH